MARFLTELLIVSIVLAAGVSIGRHCYIDTVHIIAPLLVVPIWVLRRLAIRKLDQKHALLIESYANQRHAEFLSDDIDGEW